MATATDPDRGFGVRPAAAPGAAAGTRLQMGASDWTQQLVRAYQFRDDGESVRALAIPTQTLSGRPNPPIPRDETQIARAIVGSACRKPRRVMPTKFNLLFNLKTARAIRPRSAGAVARSRRRGDRAIYIYKFGIAACCPYCTAPKFRSKATGSITSDRACIGHFRSRPKPRHLVTAQYLSRMGWTGRAPAPDGTQSARRACQEKKEHRHASHSHGSRPARRGFGGWGSRPVGPTNKKYVARLAGATRIAPPR